MNESSPPKRLKRQRFQPFVIKKGIVLRAKQRQKMALELSKSKNDSTTYNDPKLSQLKFNNRALSKALSEQKMENKCLADEKIQLQRDLLANHEVILALRSELQTHEEDLLQIHEVFRSSLQLLVTLTGHLNVGLQRCTAGRRRSKSVSLGAAGQPPRSSRGLSLVGLGDRAGDIGSPRGGGRKLHKVLPTVAGNVISHPSIVLPRLPAGGGWLLPPPPGSHRGAPPAEDMEDEDDQREDDEEETEEEPEPLPEPSDRGAASAPLADLSVILEQSVLDGEASGSPVGAGRRSGALPFAQVVVPAEERLFGDEAWMRQRSPGRERVVVAAEERLFGDEAWRRQRCRGPARVVVPAGQRLSGDEAWRRSDSLESSVSSGRRSQPRSSQGRTGSTPTAPAADEAESTDSPMMPPPPPPPLPAAASVTVSPRAETPTGRRARSPETQPAALCNGDVTIPVIISPAAATSAPAAATTTTADLEESVVIQRRTQRPRAAGRPSSVAPSVADETLADVSAVGEPAGAAVPSDADESVIISRARTAPAADESLAASPPVAADSDESIIVSRKQPAASARRAAGGTKASAAAAAAATAETAAAQSSPVEQEADHSVIISRKVRRPPRVSAPAPGTAPAEEADESVVISRKVRRPAAVAAAAALSVPETVETEDAVAGAEAAVEVEPRVRENGDAAPVAEAEPDVITVSSPEVATAAAKSEDRRGKRPSKRKSKAVREKRQTLQAAIAASEAAEVANALRAAVISREEATPSPELGVKERYRHMLSKRSPRAAADSRVAPASADDPLEGPSNRVWLAAPTTTGKRPRGRPRSIARATTPSRSRQITPERQPDPETDAKLSSTPRVMVDRASVTAATAAAADSSEPQLRSPPTDVTKPARRRRTVNYDDEGGAGGDSGAEDAQLMAPPAAKRGRGRPKVQGSRGGGGVRARGRGRGGSKGRRSLDAQTLPPGAEGVGDGMDSDLFVYPELPAAPPETDVESSPRAASRLTGNQTPPPSSPPPQQDHHHQQQQQQQQQEQGQGEDTDTTAADAECPAPDHDPAPAAAGGDDAGKQTSAPESPTSSAPAAAEPEARDDSPSRAEPDSVSPGTPEKRPAPETPERPVLAEPTSTTESPPAAESSTAEPAESGSPARPQAAATEHEVAASPAPSASGDAASAAAAVAAPASGPLPDSPETVPWTALRPATPDTPPRAPTPLSCQSSPGSEGVGPERAGGRRRRKPVSYAEPALNKKLRR